MRIELPLNIEEAEFDAKFFVINGDIPILIGNDILEPLGGVIDIDERFIEFKKLNCTVDIFKTKGGHYVVPVTKRRKNIDENHKESDVIKEKPDDLISEEFRTDALENNFVCENLEGQELLEQVNEEKDKEQCGDENVNDIEADAVMLMMLSECSEEEDIWNLHNIMGHTNFLAFMLEEDEASEIEKVHRYFGHRNGRKVWELFAKAGRLKGKKKSVLELLEKCAICRNKKKTPPRPKVGMPVANTFNEIVGLDLKVFGNGDNILWMVDLFTKLVKGKYIADKKPETIVGAIIDSWIVGSGMGPGHPTKYFYSDNGGEF